VQLRITSGSRSSIGMTRRNPPRRWTCRAFSPLRLRSRLIIGLRSVVKALAQARQDKKNADGKSMTQKDLATAVNAKPSDVSVPQLPSNPLSRRKLLETDGQRADAGRKIADLESGKAVPNQPLLIKLERVVGVKLRGAASLIGTPLNGPKKK